MKTAPWNGAAFDELGELHRATAPQTLALPPPTVSSRTVDWWPVYEFGAALVEQLGRPPCWPGTLEWCDLPNDDPAKLAAVLVAGVLWSLNEGTRQLAAADASKAVAAAANWPAISQRIRRGAS